MGIFDGLDALGFNDILESDIFEHEKAPDKTTEQRQRQEENPMDYLYEKEINCPVCQRFFKNHVVRKSRLRIIDMDTDFKPNYKTLDPNRYEVLMCTHCGYAAAQARFPHISEKQIDILTSKVRSHYKPKIYPVPLSAEHAAERNKMALFCAVALGVKNGDKAILCLKTAWLYRDVKDTANERLFLENAFKGLKDAYVTEGFPIGHMDICTTQYMLGELSRRLGEHEEALKWLSEVILRKDITSGLKKRALDVKDLIRAEKNG